VQANWRAPASVEGLLTADTTTQRARLGAAAPRRADLEASIDGAKWWWWWVVVVFAVCVRCC
jgi:hypothetical protein